MAGIREMLQKSPWLGWAVAGVLLVTAVVLLMRGGGGSSPYSQERMTEMVTIKFTDTGEEVEMPRGRFEMMLRDRRGLVDPSAGIINPSTNQPTGFLFKKSEWEETVKRINEEKKRAAAERGITLEPPTAPEAPTPPPPPGS